MSKNKSGQPDSDNIETEASAETQTATGAGKSKTPSVFAKTVGKAYSATKKAAGFVISYADTHPLLFITALATVLAFIIEMLARHSFIDAVAFVVTRPWLFVCNVLVIYFMYSISLLLKRRYFLMLLFTIIWLGFGIADCVMMSFRVTPLSLSDLLLLKSVLTIISVYLSVIGIIIIIAAFIAAVSLIVIAFFKQKKRPVNYLKSGLSTGISGAVAAGIIIFSISSASVASDFAFIGNGYDKYGFVYSFCLSMFDRGIDQPKDYNEKTMADISKRLNEVKTNEVTPDANIIYLQLESLFDLNYLNNVTYSENPVPVFSALKKTNPYAFISVPAYGAGTANTEFEVLTQFNIDYFGIGETPYKTVMQEKTCETMAFDLKETGAYTCHAIHNHQGTFYERNIVYADLGFDTFTSLEYMNNVETNPNGWAKDKVLTQEIVKALDSTKGLDFVFAISVQAHGKYGFPDEYSPDERKIRVTSGMEDNLDAFEYYINQVYQTDAFVGELIEALSDYDENVILVLYGDHYPAFNFGEADLSAGTKFQTEYIVWSNYGIESQVQAHDIEAYQMSSLVMSALGYNNGMLTKFHSLYSDSDNYDKVLSDIEYDVLGDDGMLYVYGGVNPYTRTKLQMGTVPVTLTGIEVLNEAVYISGSGFTEWSEVKINGERIESTIFINSSTLLIRSEDLPPDYSIVIEQVGADTEILSRTPPLAGSRVNG